MDTYTEGGGRALVKKPKKQSAAARHKRQLEKFKARLHELGWRRSFIASHVDEYIGEELDEHTEGVLLDEHAKSWIQTANKNNEGLRDCDLLHAAGLSKRLARKLSDIIEPLYNTCYTRSQLLEIAIEYALEKYEKVMKPGQEYYIGTPASDIWTPNLIFKSVYNVSGRVCEVNLLRSFPGNNPSERLFFHATNIRSALQIVNQGISHRRGRECLDFGIYPSFYMTPDLSAAFEWSKKKKQVWQGEMCILVYSIPYNSWNVLNGKWFNSADSQWTDLVTSSRRCGVESNDLDLFDAVYGPMAANIEYIKNKLARPHKTPKFQLASKSIASDRYFKTCFAGAIFMRVES